jgi:glycine cleavage system T protein (aminomethyltransferase)
MSGTLAQTPLHAWHAAHGARLVDFAGWSMPVQYTSIVAEHNATRSRAGLFDIAHMGRLRFDGPGAAALLDSLVTRRVADLRAGQIRYGLVTNDNGGIKDDVLVYRLAKSEHAPEFLMVVNASNREKIVGWIRDHLGSSDDASMTDMTEEWAMIAVQGPQALAVTQPLVDVPLAGLKYYHAAVAHVAGTPAIVSRTGYTGEDGCELILFDNAAAVDIWQRLVDAGAAPAGLGSRDTLRLEAAMPLYGHELKEDIDPITAGLEFAVNLPGRSFPGSQHLAQIVAEGPARKRVGLALDGKRIAREGDVLLCQGRPVGMVTSGTFSPTLQKSIAMGYIDREFAAEGAPISVNVRERPEAGRIVALPFYRRK